ncbi:universal stress protein [Egibacter rhizosphaerae]|uniref:Universal stress protein n=1 Tax=Egibacter rhizosphaerae TaxID=1670831 RepID=A0A411YCW4_9ACTN|nr:universal stress protein [Egibacter rhizosphaerae]QBI19002.1 universal stress protein [Egibacter rhizosphaerae]
MGTVVVGLDGSVGSREALPWAVDEARDRDAKLSAVYVYPPPDGQVEPNTALAVPAALTATAAAGFERSDRDRLMAEARQRADDLIRQMLGDVGARDVRVERTPIPDPRPARVLIDHTRRADLLVLGTRGLGGFKGLLLGSVAQHCVRWAECPVLVVRPSRDIGE